VCSSDLSKNTFFLNYSYDKKCKLLAYTQQVKLGPFDPNIHGNVGVLDVIGKDRKIAWQKLGSMSRTVALARFA